MAYDENLAERLRAIFNDSAGAEEKKMFGGLCFMVSGHMCCGIVGNKLMARVGPQAYESALATGHVAEMKFTGKPMKGMIYVNPPGISEDTRLRYWVDICLQFIRTLPPKK